MSPAASLADEASLAEDALVLAPRKAGFQVERWVHYGKE